MIYNIGDKVKITDFRSEHFHNHYLKVGSIATIVAVSTPNCYLVEGIKDGQKMASERTIIRQIVNERHIAPIIEEVVIGDVPSIDKLFEEKLGRL